MHSKNSGFKQAIKLLTGEGKYLTVNKAVGGQIHRETQ